MTDAGAIEETLESFFTRTNVKPRRIDGELFIGARSVNLPKHSPNGLTRLLAEPSGDTQIVCLSDLARRIAAQTN